MNKFIGGHRDPFDFSLKILISHSRTHPAWHSRLAGAHARSSRPSIDRTRTSISRVWSEWARTTSRADLSLRLPTFSTAHCNWTKSLYKLFFAPISEKDPSNLLTVATLNPSHRSLYGGFSINCSSNKEDGIALVSNAKLNRPSRPVLSTRAGRSCTAVMCSIPF